MASATSNASVTQTTARIVVRVVEPPATVSASDIHLCTDTETVAVSLIQRYTAYVTVVDSTSKKRILHPIRLKDHTSFDEPRRLFVNGELHSQSRISLSQLIKEELGDGKLYMNLFTLPEETYVEGISEVFSSLNKLDKFKRDFFRLESACGVTARHISVFNMRKEARNPNLSRRVEVGYPDTDPALLVNPALFSLKVDGIRPQKK